MIASTILTGLTQFLGSAAGQRTVNEVIDRLHPEARVDAAINSLPQLGPLPKGEPMADTTISIPVKMPDVNGVMIHPNGISVAVKTPAGTPDVTIGLTWEEILALLPAAVQLFAAVKGAIALRPLDEDGIIKGTYAAEAGMPIFAALVRQVVTDAKD